jgi:ADP-heptose:LPS heptosyltransferase
MDRKRILKTLDAHLGAWLCRAAAALNLRGIRGMPVEAAPLTPDIPHHLLIIRPGGIGDTVLMLPMLRALRETLPNATLDVACETRNAEALLMADVDAHPLVFDRNPMHFLNHLRTTAYTAAIDTEQFHHFSACFVLLSGAPVRVGFNINPCRNPLYTHLVNYDVAAPEGDQFLQLLPPLGVPHQPFSLPGALTAPTPSWPAGFEHLHSAPFVALQAGGSTPYKQWSTKRFAQIARNLHQQHGLTVALVGGETDARLCDDLCRRSELGGKAICSTAGRFSLTQTAALLAQAKLFVGIDSGLAHMATALSRPTVVLFGPSNPDKWSSRGPGQVIARRPQPCAPCAIFGYHKPCDSIACMKAISVDDVMAAIAEAIQEPPAGMV